MGGIFIPPVSYPHNVKEVSDMKRKLSVLLAALFCALSLASCGAPPPPAGISESAESGGKTSGSSSSGAVDKDALRVCVDLEYRAGYTEGKTPENAFYNLMNTVKSLGGPENVSFEYLPREGTERETALDQHLKVGNDPENLLRIYFVLDEENRLVVVGSLPRHLKAVSIR